MDLDYGVQRGLDAGHASSSSGSLVSADSGGGHRSSADRIGPRKLINRKEYVRLIQQSLHRLGYPEVALALEQQSGIQMQPPEASSFQAKILAGDWDGALVLLPQLTNQPEVLQDSHFLILQQKYLEALEAQDYPTALTTLRQELASLGVRHQQLHHLAALLLCPQATSGAERAAWLGGGAGQRSSLLAQLQSKLPPSTMLPEARLEVLVEQALEAQVSKCQYHNAAEASLSLLTDYQAGIECLPTSTVVVLERHEDEVWHTAFSHGGTMLATASKDETAIIWSIKSPSRFDAVHTLEHSQPVTFLAWSPDDTMMLSCSDEVLRLWDVATGQRLHALTSHKEAVTSCAWLPDGKRFVSGGVDKAMFMYDISGNVLQRWKRTYRVQDMAVSPNGTCLVVACSDKQVHIIRLSDMKEATLQESSPITSIALSPQGTHLLTALQSHVVHLWSLAHITDAFPQALGVGPDPLDAAPSAPLLDYKVVEGRTSRFVLRSSFGGSDATFVVHGGEDGLVYVWHRDTGDLLLKLEGHTGMVNSVAWNPTNPYMMASASDDKTVRVWLAAAAVAQKPTLQLHMAPGLL